MKSGTLFDGVRSGCKQVAEHATHVTLNTDALPTYARSLPLESIQQPEHDAATHYLGHNADTAAFFVVLDTINFGSGYFPYLQKRPGMSGYFTIASSLNDFFHEKGPITAGFLSELTVEKCTAIFCQDTKNQVVHELMRLFTNALNSLGNVLETEYKGNSVNLIESANHSAEHLVELLSVMPYFRDIEHYDDFDVPFYKRAQLMSADLALAFDNKDIGHFTDLNRLTIFADNLVPHVLRMDDILIYDPSLSSRIDTEELITSGSREEIEIRASALHTVELISAALDHKVTAMQLDYLLWNRGQQPYYKKTKPRHRTRCVFY